MDMTRGMMLGRVGEGDWMSIGRDRGEGGRDAIYGDCWGGDGRGGD